MYYAASNGKLQIGKWVKSGGKKYYVDKTGVRLQNVWIKYNGKFYYLDNDDHDVCIPFEEIVAEIKRLGYKGYNAFKLALAQSTAQQRFAGANPLSGQVEAEDSLPEVCLKLYNAHVGALTQTLELLELEAVSRAVDLMEKETGTAVAVSGNSVTFAVGAYSLAAVKVKLA